MKAKVRLYPSMAGPSAGSGLGSWHFLTLPVRVTIGKTSWKTSIFPDKKAGAYLLPLKNEVRKKEKIVKDDMVTFEVEIRI